MLISKFNNEKVIEDIAIFEKKYGLSLPIAYKNFLTKYNGGKTPETNFRINKISSDIEGFYGFGDADENFNFSFFERTGRMIEYLSDKLLPIASNCFGDYIMLGIGKENYEKIYFYYHDRETKYKELSNDFTTFIGLCKSRKIGHIRTIDERKNDMIKNGLGDKITESSIKGWQAEIDEYANIHQEKLILDLVE